MAELLHCPNPWCMAGGTAMIVKGLAGWRVACGCGIRTDAHALEKEAVAAWNTRAPVPQSVEVGKALAPLVAAVEAFEGYGHLLYERGRDSRNKPIRPEPGEFPTNFYVLSRDPRLMHSHNASGLSYGDLKQALIRALAALNTSGKGFSSSRDHAPTTGGAVLGIDLASGPDITGFTLHSRLGDRVTLRECPPGLFVSESGGLGLKTEYGAMEAVGPVNVPGDDVRWKVGSGIEVYVAESGEAFWGGASTKDAREALLVYPLSSAKPVVSESSRDTKQTPTSRKEEGK